MLFTQQFQPTGLLLGLAQHARWESQSVMHKKKSFFVAHLQLCLPGSPWHVSHHMMQMCMAHSFHVQHLPALAHARHTVVLWPYAVLLSSPISSLRSPAGDALHLHAVPSTACSSFCHHTCSWIHCFSCSFHSLSHHACSMCASASALSLCSSFIAFLCLNSAAIYSSFTSPSFSFASVLLSLSDNSKIVGASKILGMSFTRGGTPTYIQGVGQFPDILFFVYWQLVGVWELERTKTKINQKKCPPVKCFVLVW